MHIEEMTDEKLKAMMREHNELNPDRPIREDIRAALLRYANQGIKPGDFLTAVLENDLMEAMGRADSYNRATIHQICTFVYNELPHNSHGSPDRVAEYLAQF